MTKVLVDRALVAELAGYLESISVSATSRNNAQNLALEMLGPLRTALGQPDKTAADHLEMVDAFADAKATWWAEHLYGTSKAYTAEKKKEMEKARDAVIAALAQPQHDDDLTAAYMLGRYDAKQQEPVAQLGDGFMWCDTCRSVQQTADHSSPNDHDVWCKGTAQWVQGPFYTHPPRREWVPLTDQQMRDALRECPPEFVAALRIRWPFAKDFARAIEAKLREANT